MNLQKFSKSIKAEKQNSNEAEMDVKDANKNICYPEFHVYLLCLVVMYRIGTVKA